MSLTPWLSLRLMRPGQALDPLLDEAVLEIARIGAVSEESARGILEWHGQRAPDIARMALVSAELARSDLSAHFARDCGSRGSIPAESLPSPLGDVLLRTSSGRAGRVLVRIMQP